MEGIEYDYKPTDDDLREVGNWFEDPEDDTWDWDGEIDIMTFDEEDEFTSD